MSKQLVNLSNDEIKQKGEALAMAVGELYAIRADKKEVMRSFKDAIDEKEKLISKLQQIVSHGQEMRIETMFDSEIAD